MNEYYVLEGHTPVAVAKLESWASSDERRVGFTQVGDVEVSTVFLQCNHAYGDGPPILFETMVFGGALDTEQERYHTWDEAEAGHAEMVARVREAAGLAWR
jgi:hypothetical protein